MTRLMIVLASLVIGYFAAVDPEGLRRWVDKELRRFSSLHDQSLQFIDRLLSDLDRRYPIIAW